MTTCLGSAETARELMTEREASKARSRAGSEVYIEAESAAVGADDASVLAVEFAASGGKDFCGRRSRSEHFAEAINSPAFEGRHR